jgi:hypothetical protein
MSRLLDKYLGWAAAFAPVPGYAILANTIGHRDKMHDCLPRRQGRCPGLEYCHDCPWTEGISRQEPR